LFEKKISLIFKYLPHERKAKKNNQHEFCEEDLNKYTVSIKENIQKPLNLAEFFQNKIKIKMINVDL